MRAVGYVRISKADRDKTEDEQRLSLRQQEGEVRRACETKGWDLLRIVEDFALSGNDDDRPGFTEVAALVDAGEAEVVVVRHVDRLYRKGWRLLQLVDPVAEGGAGWNVYSVQQAFDTTTPEGWFAFAQFALFGDYERRVIGKRTSAALAQLRAEGRHTGRPSLIPIEIEDHIAGLHASGLSASAVARQLMKEGVRRPVKDDRSGTVREVETWTYEHVLAAVRRAEVRRLV
ncbi:recombinase family protein [Nocardioides rotundus]|uniref:recombinase family protein n=1 Tax=Nocardioides rotundus TaxID=1774216 RepID=UPI001CBB1AB5|nr:recombinase family protein [Nocardioides rotundus]UAL29122.1 recombinase family protein [Nocardioides rotundus]